MENARVLLANALAGFLDLCMGAALAAATLAAFGEPVALWHLAAGALLGVLPDFDIVPAILSGREVAGDHHATLMHRPLAVVPAAALGACLAGGPAWGAAAFLCVLWHYAHDTPPLSAGGIAWLWPFDSRYASLRGWALPRAGGMSHRAWLERYWMRPSAMLCMEVGAGLMALALAFLIASR